MSDATASADHSAPQPFPAKNYVMRNPCRWCGGIYGRIEVRGGQNCIYCASQPCGRFQYNAPKTETGQPVRSIRSRPDINSAQRARILERDAHTCIGCGRQAPAVILHIGHLISVEDAKRIHMPSEEVYADNNLGTMCEECNLGQGETSLNPRLLWRLWKGQGLYAARHPDRPAEKLGPTITPDLEAPFE